MKLLAVLLALFIVVTPFLEQTATSSDDEFLRLESVWNRAHQTGDADALDALWADDLEVAVPDMPVISKAGALQFLRSGRVKFTRYESSHLHVRRYGDAAVVTGILQRTRVMSARSLEDTWQFTKVYVHENGRWQVVTFHASQAARSLFNDRPIMK